jgi:hypothetical protein
MKKLTLLLVVIMIIFANASCNIFKNSSSSSLKINISSSTQSDSLSSTQSNTAGGVQDFYFIDTKTKQIYKWNLQDDKLMDTK